MSRIASGALARRCAAALTTSALAACASGGTATQETAGAAQPSSAQPAAQQAAPAAAPQTGAYVVRLGTDTLFVERYTRRGNSYDIEQVLRSPQTSLRHSHVTLTPTGELSGAELMLHRIGAPPDAPLLGSTKITIAGDSATVEARRGDSVQTRRVAARGDMIAAPPASYLPYELAAMRLRASGRDSIQVSFLSPGGQASPVAVRRLGADSVLFNTPFFELRARVDQEGRLLGMSSPTSTFKITLERVPSVDINALASTWSQQGPQGPASPADSAKATVGRANVAVHYSSPRKRGRVIFGPEATVAVVPFGQVWRTGANEATRLTTARDLVIGGATVPAGTYTLWTVPSASGWKLIINKQTRRPDSPDRWLWGTMYDAQQDLARVDMTTTTVSPPVEEFTIALEPRGANAATLTFTWDTTRASVPVTVK